MAKKKYPPIPKANKPFKLTPKAIAKSRREAFWKNEEELPLIKRAFKALAKK